ncbi:hypothetical protein M758_3G228900 [Ceratodon purpureus]|nr:hypothetical protein M758_3G228900 [Ceratodon purpureus]
MGDSDRRSLLWSPGDILSDSDSEKDVKGKQVLGGGFSSNNAEVRIPIGSADSVEDTVSREDLDKLWTPEPHLVPDDRLRRSTLWGSAAGLGKEANRDEIREETRAGKRVAEIEAVDERPLPHSDTDSDAESQALLLGNGAKQTNGVHKFEVEEDANLGRSEIKDWVRRSDQNRNSMAERLSDLLRPQPVSIDADGDATARERRKSSDNGREKRVSQLNRPSLQRRNSLAMQVSERVPPEWVLLLLGCLLGLSSGISVVLFNKGVHLIHELAWAGTPREGAAWLRAQKLVDIWHRILLIPVVGGVVVGMFHTVTEVVDMIRNAQPLPTRASRNKIDWLAGIKPFIKALQAALTLGTGLSLGPEGPSVDIGTSWAHGFSNIMKNSKERRIALVAAGAAAGIASGFNAPVAGTFFAIETVLRPQHAENSPPLTTAMIILAAVISSTVSQILLGERPAFTVPPYELRSAAELPLYILLGGICGVMSVVFTRLVAWFTRTFGFMNDHLGIPTSVTPAIGALFTGIIALRYPGVLYWGFTNVDEILKTGFTATAPGQGLLAQLTVAKIVATAMCKGSGLVGGLYAPSLFIGSAAGALYGSIIGQAINTVLPGHNAVAHPQAYALVGMAALLASVCSVPLTSVLLLFELTKDYHILLPLMGAVGLAIWVAAVGNQKKPSKEAATQLGLVGGGSGELPTGGRVWRRASGQDAEIELITLSTDDDPSSLYISDEFLMNECQVAQAMSKDFVKVNAMATVKEGLGAMLAGGQRCALVVDESDILEGIISSSDLQREVLRAVEESVFSDVPAVVEVDMMLVAAICTSGIENVADGHNIVVCYPDTTLGAAEELMQPRGLHQLPVVTRIGRQWQDRGHKVVGLLHREAISQCIKAEASKRMATALALKEREEDSSPHADGAH